MSLAGCETDTTISEQAQIVGDPSVGLSLRETIVSHPTLHDPEIERRYLLVRGDEERALGGYTDEGHEGLTRAPSRVGPLLVIPSAAHVALVQGVDGPLEDARVTWFFPYDAPCFVEAPINGHYDVIVERVTLEEGAIVIAYAPSSRAPEGTPPLHFRSRDGGRSFTWDECPSTRR